MEKTAHTHIYTHIYIHIYTYIYIHIYIHIHIHIYTYLYQLYNVYYMIYLYTAQKIYCDFMPEETMQPCLNRLESTYYISLRAGQTLCLRSSKKLCRSCRWQWRSVRYSGVRWFHSKTTRIGWGKVFCFERCFDRQWGSSIAIHVQPNSERRDWQWKGTRSWFSWRKTSFCCRYRWIWSAFF